MKTKFMIFSVIITLVLFCSCTQTGKERLKLSGNKLFLNTGLYQMEMEKETEKTEQYVIAGSAYRKNEEDCYDIALFAIPYEKMKELTKQYGNCFTWGNPGTGAVQSASLNLTVLGYGVITQNKLKEIEKLSSGGKKPVIEVKISKLKTVKSMYNNNGKMVDCSINMEFYLVKDAKIIKENYL